MDAKIINFLILIRCIFLQGIVGSGIMFTLVAWCVRMRGPLFVSIFNPLMLVMVALAGSLFLEERIRLGMCVFTHANITLIDNHSSI